MPIIRDSFALAGGTRSHHHLGSRNGAANGTGTPLPFPCAHHITPAQTQTTPAPHSQNGRGRSSRHGCLPGCAAAVSKKGERRDTWSESDRSAPQVPQHPSHPSITGSQATEAQHQVGFLLHAAPSPSTCRWEHNALLPWAAG